MAGKMKDYLPTDTADLSNILTAIPQKGFSQKSTWNQDVDEMDSGTHKVITHGDRVMYEVRLDARRLTQSDADTIVDLHDDPAKAMGAARTFYWAHPRDRWADGSQVYYVVRFAPVMERLLAYFDSIADIVLWVEAVKAQVT